MNLLADFGSVSPLQAMVRRRNIRFGAFARVLITEWMSGATGSRLAATNVSVSFRLPFVPLLESRL
jgi:hypothetical protein